MNLLRSLKFHSINSVFNLAVFRMFRENLGYLVQFIWQSILRNHFVFEFLRVKEAKSVVYWMLSFGVNGNWCQRK